MQVKLPTDFFVDVNQMCDLFEENGNSFFIVIFLKSYKFLWQFPLKGQLDMFNLIKLYFF